MDSHIGLDKNGIATSFVGPDAVELFRVATLASAMGLYKAGIKPGRGCMTSEGRNAVHWRDVQARRIRSRQGRSQNLD